MFEGGPEGVIVGGWRYVIAAYSITAVVLVSYVWSLHRRLRREQQRKERP
jgi:CcmD family protein